VSTLPQAADLCEVPLDAIPDGGVTVVAYVDEDGDEAYGIATHGDGSVSKIVGLLNLAAHDIMNGVMDE